MQNNNNNNPLKTQSSSYRLSQVTTDMHDDFKHHSQANRKTIFHRDGSWTVKLDNGRVK